MSLPGIDTLSTYGGKMVNYAPVEDPTTDRDATAANQSYASTAAMTHTAPRAWARITMAATTGAMVLVAHDAVWGTSVAPTFAHVSTGVFTITWPVTVTDELGTTQTVSLRTCTVQQETGGAPTLNLADAATNVANLRLFDTSAVATNSAGNNYVIVVY